MSFRVRCEVTDWTRLDGSPYVTYSKTFAERAEAERRLAVLNGSKCPGVHTLEETTSQSAQDAVV